MKIKRANRYAANEASTDFVTSGAPTMRGQEWGEEGANEFITVAASKPAARSISETVIANCDLQNKYQKTDVEECKLWGATTLRYWRRNDRIAARTDPKSAERGGRRAEKRAA